MNLIEKLKTLSPDALARLDPVILAQIEGLSVAPSVAPAAPVAPSVAPAAPVARGRGRPRKDATVAAADYPAGPVPVVPGEPTASLATVVDLVTRLQDRVSALEARLVALREALS